VTGALASCHHYHHVVAIWLGVEIADRAESLCCITAARCVKRV
jgi:hypothetical protein